ACLFDELPRWTRLRLKIGGFGSLIKRPLIAVAFGVGEYYLPFNIWGTGYHHWLTEVAPKFVLFEDLLRSGTVLMPAAPPRFLSDFCERLHFDKVHRLSRPTFFRRLQVISNPISGHYNHRHIFPFRDRLLSQAGRISQSGSGRKLYVSRRRASRRKVANEDA